MRMRVDLPSLTTKWLILRGAWDGRGVGSMTAFGAHDVLACDLLRSPRSWGAA